MKRFDAFTSGGLIFGFFIVIFGILLNGGRDSFLNFIDIPSILIVLGGTLGATAINFTVDDFKNFPRVLKQAFRKEEYDLNELIETFVELSSKARREGLLALETGIEEVEDPFIVKGVLLAVDGIEPDVIKDIMMAEIVAMEDRHRQARSMFEKMGDYAPAWGMIGTLIGLVLMLNNLDDPKSIGPAMAIAILTTFYGAVLANLVFLPIARKLENKTEQEVFVKQIIIEGVIGVQSGQNPKILQEKLSAFVAEKEKKKNEEENVEAEELNVEA